MSSHLRTRNRGEHESAHLNPEDAKAWGLVHEIKNELFEVGAELVSIAYTTRPQTKQEDPSVLDVRRTVESGEKI
jgi:hypothetical protein